MRLLATFLFLAAAIYLHQLGGVHSIKITYNNGANPNIEAYVNLIQDLRRAVARGTDSHGIAVTRDPNLPLQDPFVQVQLESGGDEVITVIIYTVNVYVVGYYFGPVVQPILYYLDDIPREALFRAFPSPNYTHRALGFAGNYGSLPSREGQELGHSALNVAISNLFHGNSRPNSRPGALLVIIQMLSEAARIRYVEHLVRRNMLGDNLNFIPDPRAISMENAWSRLSEQVQLSSESGVFDRTIEVRNVLNQVVRVSSVVVLMREAALALLLYRGCNPRALIRMPVSVPEAVAVGRADEDCPNEEPTTNIIGRDGQCVDVRDGHYNNGNSIILWPCGNAQLNQLWTFKSDGTIRSNGKCLTTYGYSPGVYIYDCDAAVTEATKWVLYNAGTIMNPRSGLVIAAESSTQGTVLTVAEDNNSSRQAWTAGNYTQPTITYISGFREMCLQANGANNRVWLANCVIRTEPNQQWALYGDSTIRLYSDPTLCVTSDGHESLDSIILLKCQGWGNQRWTFMADGTILNPNARLVMDVENSDPSLKNIILYQPKPTGNANQFWLTF
ncbi:Unknown protein [Striga hermonthica]|uniref:Ribosome-inactivating protein n=1 Tax=Striga hermonthica TaxID=68872 RepID=A0A9N7MYT6_STRHE|nr:Unknown protein [Striga hermonthica]